MTVQPTVRPLTAELYERLPEVYRDVDPPTGYALLRFLSLIGDPLSRVSELTDALDPEDGSLPALVDADRADEAWLPWLAQLLGLRGDGTTAELRARLARPEVAWKHGSRELIEALVRDVVGDGPEVVVTSEWAPPGFGNTTATFDGDDGATFDDLGGDLLPGFEVPWTIAVWVSSPGRGLTWRAVMDRTQGRIGSLDTFGTWAGLEGIALVGVAGGEIPAGWQLRVVSRRPR